MGSNKLKTFYSNPKKHIKKIDPKLIFFLIFYVIFYLVADRAFDYFKINGAIKSFGLLGYLIVGYFILSYLHDIIQPKYQERKKNEKS